MSHPERTSIFSTIPEGLFIVLLTVAAYWFTFCYEVGYLSHFGLPSQLIVVSLQTALLVAAGIWSGFLSFLIAANGLAIVWPEHPAIRDKLVRICGMLLVPVLYVINYGFRRKIGLYI